MSLSRRELLAGATALGLGSASLTTHASSSISLRSKRLRFVHLTDLHIQPQLGATEGVNLALKRILELSPRPDLLICGGDHVMDALTVNRDRADLQFHLFTEAMKRLEMPVVSVIGNHDVFGWGNASTTGDAMYGKRMVEEQVLKAPSYRSFNRGGYHFVLLDSIQSSNTRTWHAMIDDAQLSWLQHDLELNGKAPTIVVTHVPILTAYTQYTAGSLRRPTDLMVTANGKEVQAVLAKHNVKAVLQGHTHAVESVEYLGTRYITSGSVCGNWWKGPHLGVHPEGFLVCDLHGEEFKSHYVPYGWTARR